VGVFSLSYLYVGNDTHVGDILMWQQFQICTIMKRKF